MPYRENNPIRGGFVIKNSTILVCLITMVIIVCAFSGCTGSSSNSPTAAPTTGGSTGTGTVTTNSKITVVETPTTVTISGDKGEKMTSDKFTLSKDGWYIIKTTYTGPDVSDFLSSIVTPQMIADDQTVGGQLTLWMGPNTATTFKEKGSYDTGDNMVYVDSAGGPWTIVIEKSPTPSPVSSDTKFSGSGDTITPFFHLTQGTANFVVNQVLPTGNFNVPLEATLYNADTGELVDYITHNDDDAQITDSVDVPADGNYVIAMSGSGSYDISFTE